MNTPESKGHSFNNNTSSDSQFDLTDYVETFLAESNLNYNTGDVVLAINEKGMESVNYFIKRYEETLSLIKDKHRLVADKNRIDNIMRMNENSIAKLQSSRMELEEIIKGISSMQERINERSRLEEIDKQIKDCLNLLNNNRVTASDIVEKISNNKKETQLIIYELETFIKELFGERHNIDTHLLNQAKAEIAEMLYNYKLTDYPDEEWIDPRAHGKQQFISTIENVALKVDGSKFNHIAYKELLEVYQNWKAGNDKYMQEVIEFLYSYNVITKTEKQNMIDSIREEVSTTEFKTKFRGFRT